MVNWKKVAKNIEKTAQKAVNNVKNVDWEKVGKKVGKATSDLGDFVKDAAEDVKDVAAKGAMYADRIMKDDHELVMKCYAELRKNGYNLYDKDQNEVLLEQLAGLKFSFSDEATDLKYCINQFKINDYQVLHEPQTTAATEL